MAPQTRAALRKHLDAQGPASLTWHLRHKHSCFNDWALPHGADELKILREKILQLPKSQIVKNITAIQTCIDDCTLDNIREVASQRLKLLQDISSSSSLFPSSYWVSGVSKGKRISVGGEATVYLGHHQGEVVIIREFHPMELSELPEPDVEHMKKIVIREIVAHRQLRHPNIVSLIGIYQFEEESFPVMILQRAEYSLAIKYLESHPDSRSFLKLVLGLFDGICYLHTKLPPIIHGDLHDRNVLVSRTGDCLLCDFGLSRIRHEISRTHTTIHQGGRQRFIAPEISSGLEARIKSDVYSLAMTIYALGTMSLPFGHIDRDLAVYRAVQEGERPPPCDSLGGLAAEETVHLWSLIERMWKQDPDCRPTVPSARDEMMQIGPLAGLDPDQVRPDLKKEGSDWWAIFSPRVPRVLDVSLSLTLQHESVVCCVRFSADGKYLATGCNRMAQIYDTKTGSRMCVLVDEAATQTGDLYIRSVCFSPDGKYLATGAEDKQIKIWDIAERKIRRLLEGHTQEVYSLDFSSDGKLIVSGSGDKTPRIWDMETGACKTLAILEPETIDVGVTSVAFSPDGRWVATGSLDMVVRIWDVNTGALVERLRGHKYCVYSVVFSPDGRGLVSGSLDKSLKYWDIMPMIRAVSAGAQPGSNRVQLKQDGVVASNSGPVPGEKKDGGGEMGSTCTMAFTGHRDYVLSVAISPDGAWVVSGSKDRGVQFWNPKDAQAQLMLQGHKNSVISLDLSPAGGLLATGSGDWQARVWRYTALSQPL